MLWPTSWWMATRPSASAARRCERCTKDDSISRAASAATIVMVGGEKGHRYTLRHSRVMLHQPSGGVGGTAADIERHAEEMLE